MDHRGGLAGWEILRDKGHMFEDECCVERRNPRESPTAVEGRCWLLVAVMYCLALRHMWGKEVLPQHERTQQIAGVSLLTGEPNYLPGLRHYCKARAKRLQAIITKVRRNLPCGVNPVPQSQFGDKGKHLLSSPEDVGHGNFLQNQRVYPSEIRRRVYSIAQNIKSNQKFKFRMLVWSP